MTGRATFLIPLLTAISAVLAGCALSGDANEVTIEHFADYPGVAQMLAEDHCAKFGKAAKLAQMGLQDTYAIGLRKRVSVFHCIDDPGKKKP